MKNQIVFLGVLLSVMLTSMSFAQAHEASPLQDHINVTGEGEIEAQPDQAIVRISVSALKPNLPEAKQSADQKYRSVLKVISQQNIDEKDIKATRIQAQPQHEWQNQRRVYTGELVSRSLSITLRDLDALPEFLQKLSENQVSTIDNVETGFSNLAELRRQALGIAADDAKNKAAFVAKRLGRDLGKAFKISEHNASQPPPYVFQDRMVAAAKMAEAAPPPEHFGTQKIKATINVSFHLL